MSRRSRRGRGPVVVLAYRAVAEWPVDPFDLSVRPEHFADQVQMLAREFTLVPASEIRRPSGRPRVILTFDDAYVDHLDVVAPRLASSGVPATFFVNSPRQSDREMWWDEIVHALAAPAACDFLEIDVEGRRIAIDVRTTPQREQAVLNLGAHLETMHPRAIEQVLTSVYHQLGVEPTRCARHRHLADEEIVQLQRLGPFEIGGHTPGHPALRALAPAEAAAEIETSWRHLTELLGTPPESFAYPFGSVGHTMGPEHARMVEKAGFRHGFTTVRQDVARFFDPYLVPRVPVRSVDGHELLSELVQVMGL